MDKISLNFLAFNLKSSADPLHFYFNLNDLIILLSSI